MRASVAVLSCAILAGCSESNVPVDASAASPPSAAATANGPARVGTVRWTGLLEAVRSTRVTVPQVTGQTFRMTLTRIVPNGATVTKGDVIAEFDPLEQLDQARQSAAKYDDLSHQVRQRQADNAANVEKRRLEREQAEADLAKARLDVSKAPVLGTIEAQQNTIRETKAEARVESLRRTQPEEERADRAALRILELQRDRQRASVHADLVDARHDVADLREHEAEPGPRDHDAGQPAEPGQQHALRHELAGQPHRSRAQRDAHRGLALPRGRPGQQEVGHVEAAGEQDQAHRAEQNAPRETGGLWRFAHGSPV